jgi:hypothetical protein
MRFRPANIRLINRRSKLPRLLLALPSKNGKSNNNSKNKPIDVQALTGSLHIRIVGVCLADHRNIFRDEVRRQALVDCLDVFIEAGWPSARRLIYRLPELFD